MTAEELVKLNKRDVLKNYKSLYIKLYKGFFGTEPRCASCTFNRDFRKFKLAVEGYDVDLIKSKNNIKMKNYKLKKGFSSKIFSYPKNGRTARVRGKDMTDEQAEEIVKFLGADASVYFEVIAEKKKTTKKKKAAPEKREDDKKDEIVEDKKE